uniref:Uncharacterized protein n=1 Tax=Oryza barthii TaxID=65489 RepID=A0A0D3GR77_9ORYZ
MERFCAVTAVARLGALMRPAPSTHGKSAHPQQNETPDKENDASTVTQPSPRTNISTMDARTFQSYRLSIPRYYSWEAFTEAVRVSQMASDFSGIRAGRKKHYDHVPHVRIKLPSDNLNACSDPRRRRNQP